jgi:hypothetical protein
LARHVSLPSFLSTRRSEAITVAAAGTLTLAAAISAAATQIRSGLTYIQGRYGSPCGAWDHEEADGWY